MATNLLSSPHPTDEWADGNPHHTHARPRRRWRFPTHLESESYSSTPNVGAAHAQDAQSYLPSLEQAKAYLPQGVAAYLPSSPSTASAPVDVGHATSVPYTESAPEPYRQDTNSSSTVNVGHGATVPYTESAPEPYSQPQSDAQSQTSFATSTSTHSGPGLAGVGAFSPSSPTHSTTAHTGHAASATGVPPPASGLLSSHPGVGGGGDAHTPSPALGAPGPPSPAVVQSPTALEPRASTELALAAEHPVSSPLSGAVGVNAGRPRSTSGLLASHPVVASSSAAGRPTPSPDLLPSHPAAGPQPHVHAYPAHTYDSASSSTSATTSTPNVHAYPTQSLDAAVARHPTPHAVPLPSSSIDSGYAASSESGLVSPPPPPPHSGNNSNNGATFPPFVGDLGLSSTTGAQSTHGVQGSAALNSSRLADVVPTGDFDRSAHHEHSGAGVHTGNLVPTGDPPSTEYNTSSSTPDADSSGGSAEEGEGGDGDGKTEGAWGGKGKGRKGKLLQKLKEKMHVGSSSGISLLISKGVVSSDERPSANVANAADVGW
ncbi:hypothetical protein B0H16DRAFT_1701056 [Mycena metata]|uniref:Uncharacterized protein n=1 Tax=Mycena metata TaxID=1033252 RepID=A0AAD7HBQ7_9AGAR|nr:hypothetical protein B0H16DRAFT_1701056 [Mycena metata]